LTEAIVDDHAGHAVRIIDGSTALLHRNTLSAPRTHLDPTWAPRSRATVIAFGDRGVVDHRHVDGPRREGDLADHRGDVGADLTSAWTATA